LQVGGILANRADIFVSRGVSIILAVQRHVSETVFESLTVRLAGDVAILHARHDHEEEREKVDGKRARHLRSDD
jgi:D-tyrosyl-tRNA(Tyr) deacylase